MALGLNPVAACFVNKFVLEHSHTLSFMYCVWLLSGDNSNVE